MNLSPGRISGSVAIDDCRIVRDGCMTEPTSLTCVRALSPRGPASSGHEAAPASRTSRPTRAAAILLAAFAWLTAPSAAVAQLDTIAPVFERSRVNVLEGGSTRVGIKLNADPGRDVTVRISRRTAGNSVTLASGQFTIPRATWNIFRFGVIVQEISLNGPVERPGVQFRSTDYMYFSVDGSERETLLVAEVIDTDERRKPPGVEVSKRKLRINNFAPGSGSSSGTYAVKLTSRPHDDVEVQPVRHSTAPFSITRTGSTASKLNFTPDNWNEWQEYTVSFTSRDSDMEHDLHTVCHRTTSAGSNGGDPDYQDLGLDAFNSLFSASGQIEGTVGCFSVVEIDQDVPGIVLDPNQWDFGWRFDFAEGSSRDFDVRLRTRPSANVTLTPVRRAPSDLHPGDATITVNSLTFTTSNWNRPQTLTFTAAEDDDDWQTARSQRFDFTTYSSDPNYANRRFTTIDARAIDNDGFPGVRVADRDRVWIGSSERTERGYLHLPAGQNSTYHVRLPVRPQTTLPVTVRPEAPRYFGYEQSDWFAAVGEPVVFTRSNWNEWQPITVRPHASSFGASGQFRLHIETSDPRYRGLRPHYALYRVVAASAGGTSGVSGTEAPAPQAAITARFETVPEEHDGGDFTFELHFSENPTVSYRTLRNHKFEVTGGTVRRAKRIRKGSNLGWTIHVRPDGLDNVELYLPPSEDCTDRHRICTRDGKRLALGYGLTVPGPLGFRVGDAEVREGAGAVLEFPVELNRAPGSAVSVDIATADGTAVAGSDYVAVSETLTFRPGETRKTVSVRVLDDAHDEGSETMTLRLSNASGARIADDEATGTISNADPLQQEWLAGFGRAVAGQMVEALGDRFALPADAPSHMTLAGRRIEFAGMHMPEHGFDRWREDDGEVRTLGGRELLLGSSFHFTSGPVAGLGTMTGWGRALQGYSGRGAGRLSLSSELATGVVGLDWRHDGLLAGVALTQSVETGTGSLAGKGLRYGMEGELSTVLPYVRVEPWEGVSVWGMAGSGSGTLSMTLSGPERPDERHRTDIAMTVAAAGAHARLLEPGPEGGLALAMKADAFLTRTESEAVTTPGAGNLAGGQADASRLRAVLEGARAFSLDGGGALTPSLSVGLRHDGGDGETGSGVELGAGVAWSDPASGVTSEVRLRSLVAHEAGGYEEWGVSGYLRIAPGSSGRGLSLSLSPSWGGEAQGAARLWDAASGSLAEEEPADRARLDTELGYGMALRGGLIGTPYAGLGFGNGRDYRLGWRMSSERLAGFSLGLEASRGEAGDGGDAEHAVALRGALNW